MNSFGRLEATAFGKNFENIDVNFAFGFLFIKLGLGVHKWKS
jgi:hypothetical protein